MQREIGEGERKVWQRVDPGGTSTCQDSIPSFPTHPISSLLSIYAMYIAAMETHRPLAINRKYFYLPLVSLLTPSPNIGYIVCSISAAALTLIVEIG